MLKAISLTSRLHGPRARLSIPKPFEDLETMLVIGFAHVCLVSHFTPSCGWLETVESGTPKREYECSVGLVWFVIGRYWRVHMCVFGDA